MRKPPGLQVMHGLDNAKGLAFGPEGALYVAEAGRGGPASGLCWTSQAGSRSPLLRRDGRDLALLARKAGTDRHRSAVAARVWRVLPDGSKTIYADGLTQVTDLAFGPDGSLYVLQHAAAPFVGGPGSIVRIAPNGAGTIVDTLGRLNHPAGLVVGPAGALYVANFSIAPDVGEVLKIVP